MSHTFLFSYGLHTSTRSGPPRSSSTFERLIHIRDFLLLSKPCFSSMATRNICPSFYDESWCDKILGRLDNSGENILDAAF